MGTIGTRLVKLFDVVKPEYKIPIIITTVDAPTKGNVKELQGYMIYKKAVPMFNQLFGSASQNHIKAIANLPFVLSVYYDEPVARFNSVELPLLPPISISENDINIPITDSAQYIGANKMHDEGFKGNGIKVAVIDTGVNREHPMLKDTISKFVNIAKENGSTNAEKDDGNGHGTHVATTIAGRNVIINSKVLNRKVRLQGVAPEAEIIAIKVLDDNGSGKTSWVIEGIAKAVELGADVINMSLGTSFDNAGLSPDCMAVNKVVFEQKIICVVAAGNSFVNFSIGSPGSAIGSLTVGSNALITPSAGIVSTFSSKGTISDGRIKPDISAPGGNMMNIKETIYSGTSGALARLAGERYIGIMGTSMATPHVSGCLALLFQAGVPRDRVYIENLLANTAMFSHLKDINTGWGMINVKAAYDSFINKTELLPVSKIADVMNSLSNPLASLIPQSSKGAYSSSVELPYML